MGSGLLEKKFTKPWFRLLQWALRGATFKYHLRIFRMKNEMACWSWMDIYWICSWQIQLKILVLIHKTPYSLHEVSCISYLSWLGQFEHAGRNSWLFPFLVAQEDWCPEMSFGDEASPLQWLPIAGLSVSNIICLLEKVENRAFLRALHIDTMYLFFVGVKDRQYS